MIQANSICKRTSNIESHRSLLVPLLLLIPLFFVLKLRAASLDGDLSQGASKFVDTIRVKNPTSLLRLFSEQGTSYVSGTYVLPKATYSLVEIREDFEKKTGVYCVFFDTACVVETDAKGRAQRGARPGRIPLKAVIDQIASAKEWRLVNGANEANGQVTLLLSSRTVDTATIGEDAINFYFRHENGDWKLRNIEF
jgi:hypothetical protein